MKLRLYLDTSVISAYVDDRLPERRQATREFWSRLEDYDVSISDLTASEIQTTQNHLVREQMTRLVLPFRVIPVEEESLRLAQEYINRGVFSSITRADGVHVAVAVVSRQDILVSWNFRHLVNRRRRALINQVNILKSYPTIEILAPPEV